MRKTASFDVLSVETVQGPRLWADGRTRTTKKPSKHIFDAQFRAYGEKTPRGIVIKFCVLVDIQDIITCATFCDDRLRGFDVAMGRISHFPID